MNISPRHGELSDFFTRLLITILLTANIACSHRIDVRPDQISSLKPNITTVEDVNKILGPPMNAYQGHGNRQGDSNIKYTYETKNGTLVLFFDSKTKLLKKLDQY
jgi:hypothetical protein